MLLSLVCAQALAFMHGVTHVPHAGSHQLAHAVAAPVPAVPADAGGHPEHGLQALFASHEDAQDCRLLDAAGQQLLFTATPSISLPRMPAMRVQRLLAGAFIARRAAQFEARGPPAAA
ncbi:MAG: hypothetical protein EOO25_07020 [Comamonadaceae bacterium]|nr:MAG: hypothetical protein EOO25_07020 [Comamonadaceae bacterium]